MKFIIDNIFLIALALVSGVALLVPYLQQRGNKLSLLQATQMLNQGKTLVLDVRDTSQFAAGHLRDARNIPLKELPQRIGELDKLKGRAVIVVCQNGSQAMKAESTLKKAGFADVYGLQGGIAAWQGQGLPLTVKDAK
ncbi:rhodanese-like domain-containing protein [Herbaspirillum sp. alder98]|uniref:rhodanese-like domain-containing protein n=1 Tax=Herbaspirillum sp. alder98 TaxID=2913096 RepID=UPI001CD90CB4|nr:rhodanese-like domain-containing protein [Herbaspirillum sp. alder98]MCA1325691.1 rhodanese-like domain-containing protein [Herbaspirillum sp. alder98]